MQTIEKMKDLKREKKEQKQSEEEAHGDLQQREDMRQQQLLTDFWQLNPLLKKLFVESKVPLETRCRYVCTDGALQGSQKL